MGTSYIVATAHTCEYFTKGVDQGGPYMRVQYYIHNYSDADNFINALVGAGNLTGPITGGKVTRNSPHQHPLSPNLFCVSASLVTGLGNPVLNTTGYPDYDGGALIAAEYRALSWDPIEVNRNNSIDPTTSILYCTQELDFSSETYTVGNHTFKYSSGVLSGINTSSPAKFTIPVTELVLTFHQFPYLPMIAVRNLRGRVNTSTFLGAAAGCVLFRGGKTTREFNTDGTVVQKVQMMFAERDALHKWNWLPSPYSLTWYPVADLDGTTMFPTADLSPLLNF